MWSISRQCQEDLSDVDLMRVHLERLSEEGKMSERVKGILADIRESPEYAKCLAEMKKEIEETGKIAGISSRRVEDWGRDDEEATMLDT